MRYVLAIACVAISFVLLGYINYAMYVIVSTHGVKEFFDIVTGDGRGIAIFSGCWIGGLAFLAMAVAVLAPAKKQVKN